MLWARRILGLATPASPSYVVWTGRVGVVIGLNRWPGYANPLSGHGAYAQSLSKPMVFTLGWVTVLPSS
ncbi:MAG: hypothetical protein AAGD07_10190 [Planctomycetota bacterium]